MHRYAAFFFAVLAIALAACTSGPAVGTLAPGQTAGAQPTAVQPTAVPTQVQPPVAVSCAGVPTFNLSGESPTFTRDTQLESRFPATIDGQPATDLTSGYWFEIICYFGGPAALGRLLGELPQGLNVSQMSYASVEYTVDGEEVSLVGFRTPGQEAASVLQSLIALSAQTEGADVPVNLAPAVVGGKNVLSATDEFGNATYAYVTGETMIFAEGITESQASKAFAALP